MNKNKLSMCLGLSIIFTQINGMEQELVESPGNGWLSGVVRSFQALGEILTGEGLTVEADNNQADHPLLLAAEKGDERMVLQLLKEGANPLITDAFGQTALHKAAAAYKANICKLLLNYPPVFCKIVNRDSSRKRIMAALCAFKRYANLPRAIIYSIFSQESDLRNDLAIMLLLDTTQLKKRNRTVTVTNSTSWRLVGAYEYKGKKSEFVSECGSKTVIPVDPEEIDQLVVATYGKWWGSTQLHPLDLTPLIREIIVDNNQHDIECKIDGYVTFSPLCVAYDIEKYEPCSVINESRRVVDAFAMIVRVRKENVSQPVLARYYLDLPETFSDEALEEALHRLKTLWENEIRYNIRNLAYARRVLEYISQAYKCLKDPEEFLPLIDEDETVALSPDMTKNVHYWLKKRYLGKKILTPSQTKCFFIQLCFESCMEMLTMKDGNGFTAYEIAKQSGDALNNILNPKFAFRARYAKQLEQIFNVQFSMPSLKPSTFLEESYRPPLDGTLGTLDALKLYGVQCSVMLVGSPLIGAYIPLYQCKEAWSKDESNMRKFLTTVTLPLTVPAGLILVPTFFAYNFTRYGIEEGYFRVMEPDNFE